MPYCSERPDKAGSWDNVGSCYHQAMKFSLLFTSCNHEGTEWIKPLLNRLSEAEFCDRVWHQPMGNPEAVMGKLDWARFFQRSTSIKVIGRSWEKREHLWHQMDVTNLSRCHLGYPTYQQHSAVLRGGGFAPPLILSTMWMTFWHYKMRRPPKHTWRSVWVRATGLATQPFKCYVRYYVYEFVGQKVGDQQIIMHIDNLHARCTNFNNQGESQIIPRVSGILQEIHPKLCLSYWAIDWSDQESFTQQDVGTTRWLSRN